MNQTFTLLLPEHTSTTESKEMPKAAEPNQATYEPSDLSVMNILNFSKALRVTKSAEGKRLFEMVLN